MTRFPVSRVGARLALVCALLAVLPAAAEQELPVYPGTLHTRIGNDLVIGGEYYRLAYFTTPDPMKKVAAYFAKKWQDEGYPTVVEGDLEEEGVVSALFTRQGLQRGVVLRRHLGKTLGFTVLRDLWVRPPKKPAPGLVKLEGSLYSQDVSTRDDPGGSQSRTSLVSGGLTEVQQKVSAEMERRGYEPVRQSALDIGGATRVTLEHARKGEQVVTTLSAVDEGVTAVMQLWVGSDRPDGVPNDEAVRESREAYEKAKKKGEGGK
ncbi:hypothetical protein JY651_08975 [Pyxidicoccus parkwayensis]|jgi:hypothetical protein|uniref:Uncharacterized protein n=1 Tax=Pyxidicoccus parkwayensis TaxID=2813578 RepID=A0ABX7P3J2_9BACT|nr:hypothetical protein [Pyxidicoccus parkwaysis]QSQ25045.1 hypothetical protein JY651_08975 [Pyxidicoccus parkwaysis]